VRRDRPPRPDDEGRLALPGAALGMRRLSVIDVARGHQPMANEDGTVHVVFNGEIYNHHELHERLARRGHRFRTQSDTETLVHLYEDHGAGLAEHLRGMFGFAVYDATRRRLVLARDRLGQKPLYYWERDGGLAFASEVRSLREFPGFRADIDPAAVAEYLRLGYVPDPLCIYRGVRKLPPGHVLVWERGGGPARVERYWTPVRAEVAIGEADAVAELRRLLSDAVRSHLESEVPLGAFLSGGVDSSAVVAEMARQLDRPGAHVLDRLRRRRVQRGAARRAGRRGRRHRPHRADRAPGRRRARRAGGARLRRAVR
jgi:asparagine synthase (glutamine-hydrolysing)